MEVKLKSHLPTTSVSTDTTNGEISADTPLEETMDDLRALMLNIAPNKLSIHTSSEIDRFKLNVIEPVSLSYLENYYRDRYNGMEFNILHAKSNFDFVQKITCQAELDEAIRLHKMRSPRSKFRLSIVPKQRAERVTRPDIRGVFTGNAFDDSYSETATSAFTVAMAPARRKLEDILSNTSESLKAPQEWREGSGIGVGAHGSVFLAISLDTGEHLAVKKIFARGDVNSVRRRMMCLTEEIDMLSKLSHPNIVQYRGASIADDCVNVFMELMTGGSLYDEMNKLGFGALSAKRTIDTTRQVLKGLEYLHSLEIVHRDIKSANILRHAAPPVVKIGDFGSAQFYRALASLNSVDYCSTPHYTAPEVIRSNVEYGDKADIWSVGITMIEMLTKKTPYSEINPNVVLFKIAEGPIKYKLPEDCPKPLAKIIAAMLHLDPKQRPSAKALLKMEIFN